MEILFPFSPFFFLLFPLLRPSAHSTRLPPALGLILLGRPTSSSCSVTDKGPLRPFFTSGDGGNLRRATHAAAFPAPPRPLRRAALHAPPRRTSPQRKTHEAGFTRIPSLSHLPRREISRPCSPPPPPIKSLPQDSFLFSPTRRPLPCFLPCSRRAARAAAATTFATEWVTSAATRLPQNPTGAPLLLARR